MKKYPLLILLIIGFLFFIPFYLWAAPPQPVYLLKLRYDKGVVIKESVVVQEMFFQEAKNQPGNGYLAELVSFSGQKLYSLKFDFPLIVFPAPPPEWFDKNGNQVYFPKKGEGGPEVLDEAGIELLIPYFKDGKTINIYDLDNKKILSVDVGYFAKVCGDKVCQAHEDYLSCPQDCSHPTPPLKGGEKEVGEEKVVERESLWLKIGQYKWYILGGLGLSIIGLIFTLWLRRRKGEY